MEGMQIFVVFVLSVLVAIVLVTYGVRAHHAKREAHKQELQRLGFFACTDRKGWLEETVAAIQNDKEHRYEVRDPARLTGDREVYYYTKVRHGSNPRNDALVEEEVLFRTKQPSARPVMLAVKPSAIKSGLATRILRSVAAGPWDTRPDDLERLELPPDLQNSNLLGALGPRGARLYDLVDAGTLAVVQRLGDAGGMWILMRDGWCAVASGGKEKPLRLAELLSHLRPLL
jgi:hypothetical protein